MNVLSMSVCLDMTTIFYRNLHKRKSSMQLVSLCCGTVLMDTIVVWWYTARQVVARLTQ